jgi:hypothetical protein
LTEGVKIEQKLLNIRERLDKDRGKAIPLQASTGPEGSSRLRLPDFKIIGTLRW